MERLRTRDLATALAVVDSAACAAYREHAPSLVAYANGQMAARADIHTLLGHVPLSVLYRNHSEHTHFMAAQIELKSSAALITSLIWIYRTHLLRGIDPRTFLIDMDVWRDGVERYLEPRAAAQISAVYTCLSELHSLLLEEARAPQIQPPTDDELRPHIQRYLQALLAPDAREALRVTKAFIQTPDQIATWWEHVIKPTMYEIGQLWAQGEISVGQEHLATAITQRVMAHYYPQILDLPRQKGRIVVTASPGELHEIGARILADILELNGWDTYYTGASTPASSIIELLVQTGARFLCLSTTLVESLPAVMELIAEVRCANLNPTPLVLVGGQAYLSAPDLWRQVGADWFADTAEEGIRYIEAAQI